VSGGDRAQFIGYGGPERREEILAAKKKRYREDEDYRRAILARSRASYRAKPGGRPRRGRNRPKPYMWPDGQLTVLIGLGQLADMCGVTKQAIRRYEARGVIPVNHLVDRRRRRWYPLEFANFLAPLLQQQAKRRSPLRCLALRVEQAWQQAVAEGTGRVLPREQENGSEEGHGGGSEEGYSSRDDGARAQDGEDRNW